MHAMLYLTISPGRHRSYGDMYISLFDILQLGQLRKHRLTGSYVSIPDGEL